MTQDVELQGAIDEAAAEAEPAPPEPQDATEPLRAELEEARRALEEEQGTVATLQAELATSLTRYREALLAGAPEVPSELVQGDTVTALDETFARAKGLVEQVQRRVESRAARERVPAGAPARGGPDLSSLSPQEKIRLGLQQLME